MKQRTFRHTIALTLCAGSLLLVPASGQAQDSGSDNDWQFTGNIYLWGAGIEGTTSNDREIDVPFDDLVDNLDFALMFGLEARKAKWSLVGDFIFLDLGKDKTVDLPLPSNPQLKADVDVEGTVINLLAGYNLSSRSNGMLDAFVGLRFLELEATIEASVVGGPGPGTEREVSDLGNVLDGIVGIRGQQNLTGNWYLRYLLDVGAGDSDMTWQVVGGVGYQLKRWDLTAVYRHIEWEFDSDSELEDLNFSGPGFLAQFHF